jgi:hypothetical protein
LTAFQGLKVVKEFKEETGYNHPFINTIKGHLSELQKERMRLADLKIRSYSTIIDRQYR